MKEIKNWIKRKLWPEKEIFEVAGNIAERFHNRETGEFDDLREKLTYWIKCGYLKL